MYKIIPQTLYRKGLKEKILQTSMQMFKVHGIKAVKMDDIATRLSISKRTLYEIYANKEVFYWKEFVFTRKRIMITWINLVKKLALQ